MIGTIIFFLAIGWVVTEASKDSNKDGNANSNNSNRYRTVGKGLNKKIYDTKTKTYIVS